jgi:trehalose 6-phosphate phosphatase
VSLPPRLAKAAAPMLAKAGPGAPFLLMLDFDGTLARIRRHPDLAELPARWRRLLARLQASPGLTLAFVSGRGLPDLKRRAALPGALYVGNHGLAWSKPALGPGAGERRRWRQRAQRARAALRPLLKRYPGAFVEDKGLDLTVHYRDVAPARHKALAEEMTGLCGRQGLYLRRGHKALELRQPTGWDKGRAVARLLTAAPRGCASLFAGDDVTDEAGFKALRGRAAFSLRIGAPPSQAKACGRRRDLFTLLTRLERLRRGRA